MPTPSQILCNNGAFQTTFAASLCYFMLLDQLFGGCYIVHGTKENCLQELSLCPMCTFIGLSRGQQCILDCINWITSITRLRYGNYKLVKSEQTKIHKEERIAMYIPWRKSSCAYIAAPSSSKHNPFANHVCEALRAMQQSCPPLCTTLEGDTYILL